MEALVEGEVELGAGLFAFFEHVEDIILSLPRFQISFPLLHLQLTRLINNDFFLIFQLWVLISWFLFLLEAF